MSSYHSLQDSIEASLSIIRQNSFFLQWLAMVSAITFIVSLVIIPWVISKLPTDFFIKVRSGHKDENNKSRLYTTILVLLRNIFGLVFLIAGIIMLFMPGQGILTIVLGISIMAFPGKRRLVNMLLDKSSIQQSLNWIRRKTHKDEFDGFH